jgi:hypothetical protein
LFYLLSIYFSVRQYLLTQKVSVWQNKTAGNKALSAIRADSYILSIISLSIISHRLDRC